jgi:hypothetical protein
MNLTIEVIIDVNTAAKAATQTCRDSIDLHGGARLPTVTAWRDTADQVFLGGEVDIFIVTSPTHVWTPTTLELIVEAFTNVPDLDVFYGSEVSTETTLAWSPDRLRTRDYLGGVVALSGRVARRLGGIRIERYPHHRWDLALRATEIASRIETAPVPLAHRVNAGAPFANPECVRRGRQVLNDHLNRVHINAQAEPTHVPTEFRLKPSAPAASTVSVVIPSLTSSHPTVNDQIQSLHNTLQAMQRHGSGVALETLVIVGTSFPTDAIDQLVAAGPANTRVLPTCRESSMKWRYLDIAASCATGNVVIILDDNAIIDSAYWLETLSTIALEPHIGAVCATHPTAGDVTADRAVGDGKRSAITRVTAAPSGCIAMRRTTFERMSGLLDDTTGTALPLLLRRRNLDCVATDAVRFHRHSTDRTLAFAT